MSRISLPVFLAVTVSVVALRAQTPFSGPQVADIKWFNEAVKTADSVEVLEGLPHPYWETDIRAVEAAKPNIQNVAGELFYPKSLYLSIDQKSELTQQFLEKTLFVVPNSDDPPFPKACGGFHADYALRWNRNGSPVAAALICFGCEEVMLVGEKVKVSTNMSAEGKKYFTEVLKPLRQSRPPSKIGTLQVTDPGIPKPQLPMKIEIPGMK